MSTNNLVVGPVVAGPACDPNFQNLQSAVYEQALPYLLQLQGSGRIVATVYDIFNARKTYDATKLHHYFINNSCHPLTGRQCRKICYYVEDTRSHTHTALGSTYVGAKKIQFAPDEASLSASGIVKKEMALKFTLKLNPHLINMHIRLGQVLFQQNKLEEAKEHFTMALKKQPQNESVLERLILVAMYQNQVDEALQYLKQLEKIHPFDYSILDQLSDVLKQFGYTERVRGVDAVIDAYISSFLK